MLHQQINEYKIPAESGHHIIMIPMRGELVGGNVLGNQLVLWALVFPNNALQKHGVHVLLHDEALPHSPNMGRYLFSAVLGVNTYHVFDTGEE